MVCRILMFMQSFGPLNTSMQQRQTFVSSQPGTLSSTTKTDRAVGSLASLYELVKHEPTQIMVIVGCLQSLFGVVEYQRTIKVMIVVGSLLSLYGVVQKSWTRRLKYWIL